MFLNICLLRLYSENAHAIIHAYINRKRRERGRYKLIIFVSLGHEVTVYYTDLSRLNSGKLRPKDSVQGKYARKNETGVHSYQTNPHYIIGF